MTIISIANGARLVGLVLKALKTAIQDYAICNSDIHRYVPN